MKAKKRRTRRGPPWWCRAALYTALWPTVELYDYRIRLERMYLRTLRDQGPKAANKYAVRATAAWLEIIWRRIFWLIQMATKSDWFK